MIERVAENRWRATFPADDTSMRESRAFVTAAIESWSLPVTDDIVLLTSEAVTNANVHTTSAEVVVEVSLIGAVIRVAVRDDDSAHPVVRPLSPGTLGGLGMRLIDMLAASWGVTEVPDGKVIWFEMPVTD